MSKNLKQVLDLEALIESEAVVIDLTKAQALALAAGMGQTSDVRIGKSLAKKGLAKGERVTNVRKPGWTDVGVIYVWTDLGDEIAKSLEKVTITGPISIKKYGDSINVITEAVATPAQIEAIERLTGLLSGKYMSEVARSIVSALGVEQAEKLSDYLE